MRYFLGITLLCSSLISNALAFSALPAPIGAVVRASVLQQPIRCITNSRRSVTRLHAEDSSEAALPEVDDGKQGSIARGYTASKKLYLLLSVVLLGLTRDYRKFTSVSGFFIAAGLSHILSRATENNRLTSETYKRLNVGLMGYNILSLFTIPGEVGLFLGTAKAYVYMGFAFVVQSYGAHMSYEGWLRGLGEAAVPGKELRKGVLATLKTLWPTKEGGTMYRNFLMLFIAECFRMLYNVVVGLRVSGLLEASLLTGAFARRILIATMLYSLKDAGERGRLQGNTFIKMDYLIGLWLFLSKSKYKLVVRICGCVSLTLFLVGLGQTVYPGAAILVPSAALFSCGSMFMIGGYVNQQEKRGNVEHAESARVFAAAAVVNNEYNED
jgi:hypothetical protein